MNDFETRLTEALNGGAEQAPDADGLAAGARRRSRSRRRTRVAVGIGVVVAALVVPVGVLALGGDDTPDRVATDQADEPKGWHTVEHEGVLLDIPGGWHELDTSKCEFGFARFGPDDADACTFDHEGLGFYASANFDPKHGPGVLEKEEGGWGGYVYAGDWAVYATVSDPDRARRILASARLEGQEAPDVSAGWRTESYDGLSVDVPATWREGASPPGAWTRPSPAGWSAPTTIKDRQRACVPYSTGYGRSASAAGESDGSAIRGARAGPKYPEDSWAGVAIAPDANRNSRSASSRSSPPPRRSPS